MRSFISVLFALIFVGVVFGAERVVVCEMINEED